MEGLRRMKDGKDKNVTPRNEESFDLSLMREGILVDNNQAKTEAEDDVVVLSDMSWLGDAKQQQNTNVSESNETFETMNDDHKQLVSGLDMNWPLVWAKDKQQTDKLIAIMQKKVHCRRHELFMDHKQRNNPQRVISELHMLANPAFVDLFGKNKDSLDTNIRHYLEEEVFKPQIVKRGTDKRLKELCSESDYTGYKYVELVMFPQLFVSFLQSHQNISAEQAEKLYLDIGRVISQKERDDFDEEIRRNIERDQMKEAEEEDSF